MVSFGAEADEEGVREVPVFGQDGVAFLRAGQWLRKLREAREERRGALELGVLVPASSRTEPHPRCSESTSEKT